MFCQTSLMLRVHSELNESKFQSKSTWVSSPHLSHPPILHFIFTQIEMIFRIFFFKIAENSQASCMRETLVFFYQNKDVKEIENK